MVESDDPGAVARAFGGVLDQAWDGSLGELHDDGGVTRQVAVRRVGDGDGGLVIGIEINGYQGSLPEVVRRVAEHGRAVSAFWNIDRNTSFCHGADGRLLTTFDVMAPDGRHGDAPDCLEGLRAGLPWDDGDWIQLMFALSARVLGRPFERAWLDEDFTIVPILTWPDDVRDEIQPEYDSLTYDEPTMAYALRTSGAAALRRAARAAASYAAGVAGLADDPMVLNGLNGRGAGDLLALERSLSGQDEEARPRAVRAVRALAASDPLAAAHQAIDSARSTVRAERGDLPPLRGAVLSALGDPAPPAGSRGLAAGDGAPLERYGWLARHWLAPSGRVTYIRTSDLAAVARACGVDARRAPTGPAALSDAPAAAIRQEGDWTIVVESHPSSVITPEARRRLSESTMVVHADWCARSMPIFYYLVGGTPLTVLRPPGVDDASGEAPRALRQEISDVGGAPEGRNGTYQGMWMLALAERITGVPLTPGSLDLPHLLTVTPGDGGGSAG
nr:DUF6461 domain-containing protein [Actinomadura sp. J1-007]